MIFFGRLTKSFILKAAPKETFEILRECGVFRGAELIVNGEAARKARELQEIDGCFP